MKVLLALKSFTVYMTVINHSAVIVYKDPLMITQIMKTNALMIHRVQGIFTYRYAIDPYAYH